MPCELPPDMLTKKQIQRCSMFCLQLMSRSVLWNKGDFECGIYHCQAAITGLSLGLYIVNIWLDVCRTESPSARVGTPSAFHQVFGTTSGTTPGTNYGATSESTSASSRRGLSQHTQSALISTGQHRLAASLSDLPQLAERAEGEQNTILLACTAGVDMHAKLCFGVLQNIS